MYVYAYIYTTRPIVVQTAVSVSIKCLLVSAVSARYFRHFNFRSQITVQRRLLQEFRSALSIVRICIN